MSTASAVVPIGYKQTEIGVIPEDWNVEYLFNSKYFDARHYGGNIHNPEFRFTLGIPFLVNNHNKRIDFSELFVYFKRTR